MSRSIVVHKKYIPEKTLALFDTKPGTAASMGSHVQDAHDGRVTHEKRTSCPCRHGSSLCNGRGTPIGSHDEAGQGGRCPWLLRRRCIRRRRHALRLRHEGRNRLHRSSGWEAHPMGKDRRTQRPQGPPGRHPPRMRWKPACGASSGGRRVVPGKCRRRVGWQTV